MLLCVRLVDEAQYRLACLCSIRTEASTGGCGVTRVDIRWSSNARRALRSLAPWLGWLEVRLHGIVDQCLHSRDSCRKLEFPHSMVTSEQSQFFHGSSELQEEVSGNLQQLRSFTVSCQLHFEGSSEARVRPSFQGRSLSTVAMFEPPSPAIYLSAILSVA
jgi:hypothetical protein